MFLKDTSSFQKLEAVIERLDEKDFKTVKKNKRQFNKFDWNEFQGKEVYKLRLKANNDILGITNNDILGIICLKEHSDEATNAIEIELLEVSNENIGMKKKLDNIGSCLIAFACRESFRRGHDGCIFLTPKTSLVQHYHTKYGFHYLPLKTFQRPVGLMILYEDGSRKMIKKYLE